MVRITFFAAFVTLSMTGLLWAIFGSTDRSVASDAEALPLPEKRHLKAFRSDKELREYLQTLIKSDQPPGGGGGGGKQENAVSVEVTGDSIAQESITNVQHSGVDEGGIVKLHGDYLVILRRGRLFTVSLHGDDLRPVSMLNAFGPDIDPDDSWYDEMLISGRNIVVIGYSYERGGSEVGLFNIDDEGKLKYRATYHLRSNDYYSSRNYASRLIGNRLILYSPTFLSPYSRNVDELLNSFPAVRKWKKNVDKSGFRRLTSATRVYQGMTEMPRDQYLALHNVIGCELDDDSMDCDATSVIGLSGSVFYVSPGSVYVWASEWWDRDGKPSTLYRLPLERGEPTAVGVMGSPVDQFSFLEGDDSYLNVVVRAAASGTAMWNSERTEGATALVRIALDSIGDGRSSVPASQYRSLPKPSGYVFQNRFVGKHLIYGSGSGWGEAVRTAEQAAFVTKIEGGDVIKVSLPHGVDRIERLGSDAVVIGTSQGYLHFTSLRLTGETGAAGHRALKGGSQGELRSHGFFYRPANDQSGMLGLPVRFDGGPGYEHLYETSAAIVYLTNTSLQLEEIGTLSSKIDRSPNDGCRASCVDWYGNSRPLFIKGRILALLGYELVEGAVRDGKMKEVRRIDFGPKSK